MTLRIALQMDPIASIDPTIETTFALGMEAQARGHALWYYTPDKLSWRDGRLTARAHRLTLHKNPSHFFDLGEAQTLDLKKLDVILLRQDPPFDMAYITNTYLLEKLHPKPLVVNNPAAVRDLPEKLFPLLFKQFMPPTLIGADIEEFRRFRKDQKDIVIKPLYGHSGRSVFRLTPEDPNFQSLMETLFAQSKEPWIAQRYLPQMRNGERRLVLIDGKLAAIAARIPGKNETRASLHHGAKYIKAKPTRRHLDICEAVGPLLRDKGLLFAGLDVIGDFLTEINITSPGTLAHITKVYGKKLEVEIWEAVEKRIKSR